MLLFRSVYQVFVVVVVWKGPSTLFVVVVVWKGPSTLFVVVVVLKDPSTLFVVVVVPAVGWSAWRMVWLDWDCSWR